MDWNSGETQVFIGLTTMLALGLIAIHFAFRPMFRKQDEELRKYRENQ